MCQGNQEDLQFDPGIFKELEGLVGKFTVDVASDCKGENSLCSKYYSKDNSVFNNNLAGEKVWCNGPM